MAKKDTPQNEEMSLTQEQIDILIKENESLQRKLDDAEQITKRAQSDYLRLKMDMDALITRTSEQQKRWDIDSLVNTAKKILPFVTQLAQSLQAADEETLQTPWAQGIQLIYQKMIGSVEQLNIKTITGESGQDPDLQQHIPVSTMPVEDKKLSWKIVSQIEQGYMYSKDWVEVVVVPAKVVVWQ